ncbi:tyrosine-type recombinase/integrase [Subsaximicrobium wynnwilliamsii]|uniref:Tyrosine-type recombinase/integrase n=1 Tax=Subsaximicrobium wynnwilliamsii TaxID=291179 RepID=A0A5C6ZJG0_9FLAO|nr:tyrosine-type recombinase/integrase [Subsaximicrobium wynnwilliamsii]TXD83455.1 tyrosine-type recombinase/integrase [Subsaximicrobium wynnwilliamsii]TXD83460.1 tyrosine-type recombinase/integrase [Subsaximicrobium wynnwilliamsii]TXD89265.1 tyrosine-type recombinase/integrase [Subsaximicrobium wynnwilliamsii]TXD89270.1 tyrosine-type recombinase/integrase [Subsaximicrobium wynnwilliamsii]TXE03135.1 tyrosine-type recombinase/integrase [Subsaximicrobium wynnwilliamsii]
MAIKLGKTKDSRTRKKKVTEDAELELLQRLQNEKDQPEFIKYLLQKGYSIKSSERYLKDIERYKKWLNKENITEAAASYNDITHYIQSKKGTVKQITIQTVLASLKQYYNYLQELGFVAENPTVNVQIKGIKRKVLHNILTKQELEKIYFDYKNLESESLSKKRNEIIVSLLVYQGLNTNDIQNLVIKDVKLREGKIFIKGSRRSNERTLKLEAHQILDFMEYQLKTRETILQETNKQTDLFFVTQGSSLKLQNVMQKLMQQLHKQNKQVESVKQIRASVITGWLKVYNLREVQYFAGHRYVSSTENYLINDLEDLKEDINKYHPIA